MKRLLCILAFVAAAMSDSNLETILKASNDQFSSNMFQDVVRSQGNKSCVLSAFSVLSPLAELALASVGDSHDEILKAIGLPNDTITRQVFADMNARLRSVKGVDLELANKLYIGKGYSLNDTFADESRKIFNAEFENIDFQQRTKAATEINAWVEDHTNKTIKGLIEPLSINSDTAAILVNAIYFKGTWKKPFEKYLTQERIFHSTKNLSSSLPMMYQTESFNYIKSEQLDAQFLEMEYDGNDASLIVGLPNEIDGIDGLIEKIKDPSILNNVFKDMKTQKLLVFLPKFKVETTTNLADVLEKMNITKLFQAGQAKLSKLLKEDKDLYVSSATQKAFIEVNEDGAEAAVANDFEMEDRIFLPNYAPLPEFKADHPFVFFIMEGDNIIFSGIFR